MWSLTKYLFLLALSLSSVNCFSQQDHSFADSLLNRLAIEHDDTFKVNTLNQLALYLWRKGKDDDAKTYVLRSLELGKKIKFNGGLAKAYSIAGLLCENKGDVSGALQDHFESFRIRKEMHDEFNMAGALNNIGNVYEDEGNYPDALKYFLESLSIREKIKDMKGVATSCNNVGLLYSDIKNYDEALKYHLRALGIRKKINDKKGLGSTYGNIGNTYLEIVQYTKALSYFDSSLVFKNELGDKIGIANTLNNIGTIQEDMGNYDKAMDNYMRSFQIKKELNNIPGIASCLINIGQLQFKQKKYLEAKKTLSSGLSFALASSHKEWIKNSYLSLSHIDSAMGNYELALKDYKASIAYRDSLFNEENTKKNVQTQMQYDFEKKQEADSIKNAESSKQEQLKHDQEIKQQKIYSYGGVIGFTLMLFVAGISFRAYRQKKTANEIISMQKILVEEKQKEILDSIHYAKRIQHSLLPTIKYIDKNLKRLAQK